MMVGWVGWLVARLVGCGICNLYRMDGEYGFLNGGSLPKVQRNFEAAESWDPAVITLVPGWFNETLPAATVRDIAFLRLDGGKWGGEVGGEERGRGAREGV